MACFGSLSVKDYGRSLISCLFFNLTLPRSNCFDFEQKMVCFVASHGAVFCLCSCWPWARRSGLGIPSAFIHGCTSHIALPRAHSGSVLCGVLLDPTSYCSSPEQKPALPLVVLLVLKVLLPPVLRGTHMMSTGDHPSGAGTARESWPPLLSEARAFGNGGRCKAHVQ